MQSTPPLAPLLAAPLWVPPQDGELPIGRDFEAVSRIFLGAPYRNSALGEGEGHYDSDPLARLDAFDCTTFVETVWAISRAQDRRWRERLHELRYREAKIDFWQRLHFIEFDWVPYHLKAGTLEELTPHLGMSVQTRRARLDRLRWLERHHSSQVASFRQKFPAELPHEAPLSFLRGEDLWGQSEGLSRLKAELGSGALLANFVRWEERPAAYAQVSHQGFIFLKGSQIVLRHASTVHRKVMDVDFLAYLKAQEKPPYRRGFQIYRLRLK